MLKDKVVVCHDIGCDMRVLRYQYISADVQDTALYYCVLVLLCWAVSGTWAGVWSTRKGLLKGHCSRDKYKLKDAVLGRNIQVGGLHAHDSTEDAWAAMQLYLFDRVQFERDAAGWPG